MKNVNLTDEAMRKDVHKIATDVNILTFLVVLDTVIVAVLVLGALMSK